MHEQLLCQLRLRVLASQQIRHRQHRTTYAVINAVQEILKLFGACFCRVGAAVDSFSARWRERSQRTIKFYLCNQVFQLTLQPKLEGWAVGSAIFPQLDSWIFNLVLIVVVVIIVLFHGTTSMSVARHPVTSHVFSATRIATEVCRLRSDWASSSHR